MAVVIAIVAVPTAAHAVLGPCGSNTVCMWEDPNAGGDKYVDYLQGTASGDQVEIDWFNGDNEISSVRNNSAKWVILYDNDQWSGTKFCVPPNNEVANLALSGYDNEAESFKLTATNLCV